MERCAEEAFTIVNNRVYSMPKTFWNDYEDKVRCKNQLDKEE